MPRCILNLKPAFTVANAIQNLHRLDSSLLESFTTRHGSGVQLLAGTTIPLVVEPSTAEFARLFDMLGQSFPLCSRGRFIANGSRLPGL